MIGFLLAAVLAQTPTPTPTPVPTIPAGLRGVSFAVWYEHEDERGGFPYRTGGRLGEPGPTSPAATPHPCTFTIEGWTLTLRVEGVPVAVEWYNDGRLTKRCGERPSWIFRDRFETGGFGRWSSAVP